MEQIQKKHGIFIIDTKLKGGTLGIAQVIFKLCYIKKYSSQVSCVLT